MLASASREFGYALNGVVSDLILFDERIIKSKMVEISRNFPVAASHIYILISDAENNISNVSIYEDILFHFNYLPQLLTKSLLYYIMLFIEG